MEKGDIQTITLKRGPSGSFQQTLYKDWLLFIGFTDKELEADEITLVAQGDFSKKYKQEFVGLAKKK